MTRDRDPGRTGVAEKWIYCPDCRCLRLHNRIIGGWLCQECNPPLEDFE